MGMNELMTGNRKDHIRVWKHKEKEKKSDRYFLNWNVIVILIIVFDPYTYSIF